MLTFIIDKIIFGIQFLDRGANKILLHKFDCHVTVKQELNIHVIATCQYLFTTISQINCNTESEVKLDNQKQLCY